MFEDTPAPRTKEAIDWTQLGITFAFWPLDWRLNLYVTSATFFVNFGPFTVSAIWPSRHQ